MDNTLVDDIRASSRQMVRELGFMHPTLAGTHYPPSAVHTLLEIGQRRTMTAAEVASCLGLDKSSVSRMLRKLIATGELSEGSHGQDGRAKVLRLTPQGRKTHRAIETHARLQVLAALSHLGPAEQRDVHAGLARYAQGLVQQRTGVAPATAPPAVRITHAYRPTAIGRITEMHARFYARHAGFGAYFEGKVAAGLAEFVPRLEQPCNRLWLAHQGGQIVGSVAIDGEDLGHHRAHLRWFIVDDGIRGSGMGRRLLQQALDFCDRIGFAETHLWTFSGLDAARRLYESAGFVLEEEFDGDQWGKPLREQRFVRLRTTAAPRGAQRGVGRLTR